MLVHSAPDLSLLCSAVCLKFNKHVECGVKFFIITDIFYVHNQCISNRNVSFNLAVDK